MTVPRLSGWQIVMLLLASVTVIAVAAVAFVLGKEALIAIAVILVLVYWSFNQLWAVPAATCDAVPCCVSKELWPLSSTR